MIDTLPGTSPGVIPANDVINIKNVDAAGVLALNVGSGATLKAAVGPTGWLYLCPGQQASFFSDGSTYWATSQPPVCFLQGATTFFAAASGTSSTNHGLTSAAPLTPNQAYQLAQSFNANAKTVTIQVADGTYTSPIQLIGPIPGQGNTSAQTSIFPVILQGDLATPDNALVSVTGSALGAIQVINSADMLIQGFKVVAITSGNGLYVEHAAVAYKTMDFGAAPVNQVLAAREAYVQTVGAYTISAGSGCHVLESNSWISFESTATITLTGTPAYVSGFACGQYPGSIVLDFTPTFSGSATGFKCFAFLNGIVNGTSSLPGSSTTTSTGGQCN
jgi:hypothetical protein